MAEETAGHKGQDSEGGAKKRKRNRYSHHTCWHHDAWQGILMMPPAEVGVYWRIILLMYIRRSALADSDREMARLCHCDLRVYRRIKASLIARGRIVLDEENGIIYDERTIRELVDAGFFSELQTERAMKSALHKKSSEVCSKVDPKSDSSLVENDPPNETNQADSAESAPANQYPIPKDSSSDIEPGPARAAAPTVRCAPSLPLNGGGRAPRRIAKPIQAPCESDEAFAVRCAVAGGEASP